MDDLKKINLFLALSPAVIIILVIALVILVSDSSSTNSSMMVAGEFTPPFKDNVNFTITSDFGSRTDPLNGSEAFHTGIDLSAPEGTEIVASASGVVVETGYSATGLGNYVYIEHNVDGKIYYSAYGHMLDNSIVVSEGEPVEAKQKIGVIGTSGRSTGIHCHFSLMSPKLKFDKTNLIDPKYIFESEE